MKRLNLRLFLVCGILLSFAWASPLLSQQEDATTLRQKNAALEVKVKELEALLKQCTETQRTSSQRTTAGKARELAKP